MTPEPGTIPALLARRAVTDGARQALVTPEASMTYRGLDDATAALAGRLVGSGVVKGDRVGLLGPNGIEWAVLGLAVLRVGAVLVPLSTLLRPPELLAWTEPASGMRVTSEFIELGPERTEVRIHQTQVPAPLRAPDAQAGFTSSLDRFAAYCAALRTRRGETPA